MDLDDIFDGAEMLEPKAAVPLLGRSRTTIYTWLREKHLVARRYGRSWLIPMLRDENDQPVFLFRGEGEK